LSPILRKKSILESILPLPFNGSKDLTLGVEIELQLLNPQTFDLTPRSPDLLKACKEKGLDRVKAEFHKSMIEIDTPICSTVKECQESLSHSIRAVHQLCTEMGLYLSVSGTHPFQLWSERTIYPSERYQYLEAKFQWLFRRMNVYGMHLHLGVTDGDTAIKLLNALIPYLPLFLALSTSSPFWQGIETGFHSSRLGIIESIPYSGIPPFFTTWKEFENYYDTLVSSGAINSTKDLYWLIRPNAQFGTIEIRIFDAAPTLAETAALVALAQCVTKHILTHTEQEKKAHHHWVAPANMLIASRDGLKGSIVTDTRAKKMTLRKQALICIKTLSPIAKELGCYEELLLIQNILINGTSSERQKQHFAKTKCCRSVAEMVKQEFEKSYLQN
jgi:carboxylate-amine ligase